MGASTGTPTIWVQRSVRQPRRTHRDHPLYGAEQPIADQDWQAGRTATEAIAQRYGLTTTTGAADTPGNHQVRYSNTADGVYADIGSGKAAFVTTNTGCHLPE